jgi:hypothetical protein
MHGSKDWNTLTGGSVGRPGLVHKLKCLVGAEPVEADAQIRVESRGISGRRVDGYLVGTSHIDVALPWSDLVGNTLVVGNWRTGSGSFVESLLTQHAAQGGAFVVVRAGPGEEADERLAAIMASVGRPFYRFDAHCPEKSHRYEVLGADKHTGRKVMEIVQRAWPTFGAPPGISELGGDEPSERDELVQTIEGLCDALNQVGNPYSMSDISGLLTSTEACWKVQGALQGHYNYSLPRLLHTGYRSSSQQALLNGASAAIDTFCATPSGRKLDGYAFHFNLSTARQQNAGVVLSPPVMSKDRETHRYRRLFVKDILAHLESVRDEYFARQKSLLVVVEEAGELGLELVQELTKRDFIENTACVLMTDGLDALRRLEPSLPETLLQGCRNRVLFRQSPADAGFFVEMGEQGGDIFPNTPELTAMLADLDSLQVHEALVQNDRTAAQVITPRVSFSTENLSLPAIGSSREARSGRPLRVKEWLVAQNGRGV